MSDLPIPTHLQKYLTPIGDENSEFEVVGVPVTNTHKISKLVKMISDNGTNLIITDWIDEHSEMLGEWEAQTRYDLDFLVEKRKLDTAIGEVQTFLSVNGIQSELREELCDSAKKEKLLKCLPENKRGCSVFELNCYTMHKLMLCN